ncbi:MAG: hypothetical protein CVU10_09405 [Bacteroidetes bacterium HGW-Bacteroidetes-5]|jgi:purine-binding chemotaxis protein CheW|nr:MAG: hypothetical protein CVU10_09405 [Bacteroidetes bacterium HGW-Bacteroidetes-5]
MKSDNQILRERAVKNALKIDSKITVQEDSLSFLEFTLLSQKFAIDSSFATEVHFLKEITPIPGAPHFVSGVVFHRGKIVSVINLRSLFKMRERGLTDLNKFIILSYKEIYFGIIADSIIGITQKSTSAITPPPSTVDLKVSTFISGIFPDGVVLLDAKKLITSPEIIIK